MSTIEDRLCFLVDLFAREEDPYVGPGGEFMELEACAGAGFTVREVGPWPKYHGGVKILVDYQISGGIERNLEVF